MSINNNQSELENMTGQENQPSTEKEIKYVYDTINASDRLSILAKCRFIADSDDAEKLVKFNESASNFCKVLEDLKSALKTEFNTAPNIRKIEITKMMPRINRDLQKLHQKIKDIEGKIPQKEEELFNNFDWDSTGEDSSKKSDSSQQ